MFGKVVARGEGDCRRKMNQICSLYPLVVVTHTARKVFDRILRPK